MSFKPTEEQRRIFKFIQKRKENILIEAYAGAGKTTTIVEAVHLLPKDASILFLAFNKHIKEELVRARQEEGDNPLYQHNGRQTEHDIVP